MSLQRILLTLSCLISVGGEASTTTGMDTTTVTGELRVVIATTTGVRMPDHPTLSNGSHLNPKTSHPMLRQLQPLPLRQGQRWQRLIAVHHTRRAIPCHPRQPRHRHQ
jgi:hypothetical protein